MLVISFVVILLSRFTYLQFVKNVSVTKKVFSVNAYAFNFFENVKKLKHGTKVPMQCKVLDTHWSDDLQNKINFIFHEYGLLLAYAQPRYSLPNKRTCTPYLILSNFPPCMLLFGTASLSIISLCRALQLKKWLSYGISKNPEN